MNRSFLLFLYTTLLALVIPALFPALKILFFAPYLVCLFYYKDKTTCLWFSLLSGLLVDLFSTQTRLGTYAFNYCLTTWILYDYKRHFFEDRLTTLPVMTLIFSILSTFNQTLLFYLLGYPVVLSWEWIKSDLIRMPLLDAVYAGLAFTWFFLFFPPLPEKRNPPFSLKDGL